MAPNGMARAMALALSFLLAAGPAAAQPGPNLRIVVLEGEGAINNIRQRIAKAPVVRVEDEAGQPVPKAAVVFLLPDVGAGGAFLDGANSLTVMTDEKGIAVARGLRPNNIAGEFQIRVAASVKGGTASATITQTNAPGTRPKGGGGKMAAIVALLAGGAAGAVFAARAGKSGNGSSALTPAPPAPSGTTITPGTPVFGPPR